MTSATLYVLAAAAAFGIGVYGLVIAAHVLRKLLALNVMGSAVFLFLLTVSGRGPAGPDPVAQALVLTGIVIAIATTAFGLSLMVRVHGLTGRATSEIDDDA